VSKATVAILALCTLAACATAPDGGRVHTGYIHDSQPLVLYPTWEAFQSRDEGSCIQIVRKRDEQNGAWLVFRRSGEAIDPTSVRFEVSGLYRGSFPDDVFGVQVGSDIAFPNRCGGRYIAQATIKPLGSEE